MLKNSSGITPDFYSLKFKITYVNHFIQAVVKRSKLMRRINHQLSQHVTRTINEGKCLPHAGRQNNYKT